MANHPSNTMKNSTIKKPTPKTRPMQAKKPLNIKMEFQTLQTMYLEDDVNNKVNLLLLGESGSGKSFLARTCPGPVHMDCFDPGATKGLQKEIIAGKIIADTRWEKEDPTKPTQYMAWEKETNRRMDGGYFDYLGTYILDSSTTWAMAIMNYILKKAGIAGMSPRFTHDYAPQKAAVNNWIKKLLDLPCNVIITGHLEFIENEKKQIVKRLMAPGKSKVTIPLLFDEIWVMDPKSTSGDVKYRILTQGTGDSLARSRLSADGLLNKFEDPDFSAILNKANFKQREVKTYE